MNTNFFSLIVHNFQHHHTFRCIFFILLCHCQCTNNLYHNSECLDTTTENSAEHLQLLYKKKAKWLISFTCHKNTK